jgi:hypothetical protein
MRITHKGTTYEISVHYGLKTLILTVWESGADNFKEHSVPYTINELFERMPFIKYGSSEYGCIQEMDGHINALKKLEMYKEENEELKKELEQLQKMQRALKKLDEAAAKMALGWDCPKSPTKHCEYPINGTGDEREYCIHCGLPEERK